MSFFLSFYHFLSFSLAGHSLEQPSSIHHVMVPSFDCKVVLLTLLKSIIMEKLVHTLKKNISLKNII